MTINGCETALSFPSDPNLNQQAIDIGFTAVKLNAVPLTSIYEGLPNPPALPIIPPVKYRPLIAEPFLNPKKSGTALPFKLSNPYAPTNPLILVPPKIFTSLLIPKSDLCLPYGESKLALKLDTAVF